MRSRPSPRPPAVSRGAVSLGQLSAQPAGGLASPIQALFNLMPFSRCKTVPSETLGSGNHPVGRTRLHPSKRLVTYFADSASISGNGFSSTARSSVNGGVRWTDVQSFDGQKPNAQVYVGAVWRMMGVIDTRRLRRRRERRAGSDRREQCRRHLPVRRRRPGAGNGNADRGADADARPQGRAQPARADGRKRTPSCP